MLDVNIKEQLKEVFKKLENQICLEYFASTHFKQKELVEMLEDISNLSEQIVFKENSKLSNYPRFRILKNSNDTGIFFSGVPGGHEFSSLVLAIINCDLKGKLPDQIIMDRIENLKGPISLETFISLSCENCPEVVQSLNLMASLKKDFSHEMIDGEFVPERVNELSIQGVPSVIDRSELIHSGKITLLDLLEKLEKKYGIAKTTKRNNSLGEYDVIVIGGGPAGVASAIYTSRKGLKTALITDRVGGQVQDTKGIENMISIKYTEGKALSNNLIQHISDYNIKLLEYRKVKNIESGVLKKLYLNTDEIIFGRAIIIATGAEWKRLGIEGEKEYNGRGVAFCPHCDGPYYKNKNISVIGGGNSGVEAAIDLSGIVKNVKLIEYSDKLNADKILLEKLSSIENIEIITSARINKILGDGQKVIGLEYEDRLSSTLKTVDLDGVFIQIGLVPNTSFLNNLVKTNQYGEILVTDKNRTNIDKIYAAGDVTNIPYKQIIIAMGEGAKVGLSAFEDLMIAS